LRFGLTKTEASLGDVSCDVDGCADVSCDVDADEGVVDAGEGVVDAEEGVVDVEEGVVDVEEGVVDAEEGVVDVEEGAEGDVEEDTEQGVAVTGVEDGVVRCVACSTASGCASCTTSAFKENKGADMTRRMKSLATRL